MLMGRLWRRRLLIHWIIFIHNLSCTDTIHERLVLCFLSCRLQDALLEHYSSTNSLRQSAWHYSASEPAIAKVGAVDDVM